jgi:pyruvate-ferredoxin/flavodoxin oxidoreductase
MEVAMTFADFALTEARFRKHFRKVPCEAWNDNMVVLTDFLEMSAEEREGKFPFIWTVDQKQHLTRVLVAETIVASCEERRDFWIMLRAIAGVKEEVEAAPEDLEGKIRNEVVSNIAKGLMKMAAGGKFDELGVDTAALNFDAAPVTNGSAAEAETAVATATGQGPWIESEECTACDECIKINSKVFAYNSNNQAEIKDPNAGSYEDLVKAAEKCTAQVIHPGLPANPEGQEKWIKRGEKYN